MKHILPIACLLFVAVSSQASEPKPPEILRPYDSDAAQLRLPDGTLKKVYLGEDGTGADITSTDNGKSWSEPEKKIKRWAAKAFLDRDGRMHAYFILLRQVQPGTRIAIDRFIDVWHVKTEGPKNTWGKGRIIQKGWNGSIVGNSVQLPNGRIVQPSMDWVPGVRPAPPLGSTYCVMLYSDDGGETWKQSNHITSPVYEGYNGANLGACEPVIVLLNDGRLWSLMRTQTGRLYQSFSTDGATWTEGEPSDFHASTGPPSLLRMPDNRLLLFWNNCELPPKVNNKGVYAGRDVMHAAVSEDDGKTWHGFREVMVDAGRSLSPPKKGDRGVAYPYAFLSADGRFAEIAAGHGKARKVIRVDPDWLLIKEHSDDFSSGIEGWSVFKPFGAVERWWRDRVQGAELVSAPGMENAMALHIRKPDENDADGAVWNFPAGSNGSLTMRVMFRKGHQGARIALNDRFFEPTDNQANEKAIYGFTVSADGNLAGSDYTFSEDKWHEIVLKWEKERKICRILVDGTEVATLPQNSIPLHGPSYLHLRSDAREIDTAGFYIASVKASLE